MMIESTTMKKSGYSMDELKQMMINMMFEITKIRKENKVYRTAIDEIKTGNKKLRQEITYLKEKNI